MVKAFEKSDPKRCSAARRVRGKKQFDEIIAVASLKKLWPRFLPGLLLGSRAAVEPQLK